MDDDQKLCTHCLTPIEAETDFCAKCGMGVSTHSFTAPPITLRSESDALDRAMEEPRNLTILFGLILISGPTFLILVAIDIGLLMMMGGLFDESQTFGDYLVALFVMPLVLFVAGVFTWIFGKHTFEPIRNYLDNKP